MTNLEQTQIPEFPIVGGIYKHYKNKDGFNSLYKVVGMSRHTETEEYLVIYEGLYPNEWAIESKINFFARPLNMFMDKVKFNGQTMPRFKLVSNPNKLEGLSE